MYTVAFDNDQASLQDQEVNIVLFSVLFKYCWHFSSQRVKSNKISVLSNEAGVLRHKTNWIPNLPYGKQREILPVDFI